MANVTKFIDGLLGKNRSKVRPKEYIVSSLYTEFCRVKRNESNLPDIPRKEIMESVRILQVQYDTARHADDILGVHILNTGTIVKIEDSDEYSDCCNMYMWDIHTDPKGWVLKRPEILNDEAQQMIDNLKEM